MKIGNMLKDGTNLEVEGQTKLCFSKFKFNIDQIIKCQLVKLNFNKTAV